MSKKKGNLIELGSSLEYPSTLDNNLQSLSPLSSSFSLSNPTIELNNNDNDDTNNNNNDNNKIVENSVFNPILKNVQNQNDDENNEDDNISPLGGWFRNTFASSPINHGDSNRMRSASESIRETINELNFAPWLEEKPQNLNVHEEAGIYLQYAIDCVESNLDHLDSIARNCYRRRHKFISLFRFAAWGLLLVHIFERPYWTYGDGENWYKDESDVLSGILYLPLGATVFLNMFFVFILYIAVQLEYGYTQKSEQKVTNFLAVILFIKAVDVFLSLVYLILNWDPFFSACPIEALLVILIEYEYRNNIFYLIRSIPFFVGLIVVLGVVICSYAAMGFLIFNPQSVEATEYFPDFGIGLWNMLMVLNGSNWPSPIIPAYNHNRDSFFYFIIYLLLFNWGLLNLVLGLVYSKFQDEHRSISELRVKVKKDNFLRSFNILDYKEKGYLLESDLDPFINELYTNYIPLQKPPSDVERHMLFLSINSKEDGKIMLNDFENFQWENLRYKLKILRFDIVRLKQIEQREDSEKIRQISVNSIDKNQPFSLSSFQSNSYYRLNLFFGNAMINIDNIYFDLYSDCIVSLLGIIIVSIKHIYVTFIYFYVGVSTIECILKILSKGIYRYRKSLRNKTDAFLLILIIICCIFHNGDYFETNNLFDIGVRAVLIIRIILFPRNIITSEKFKPYRRKYRLALLTVLKGRGDFKFLMIIMVTLIYSFSSLGNSLLGGVISKSGTNGEYIDASSYGKSGYWPLNFNDMPGGMATLFILLSVNNMHITTSGFVAVIGKKAELFFAIWYIVGVLFLLNVLTSFVLNQFTAYLARKNIIESNRAGFSITKTKEWLSKIQKKSNFLLDEDALKSMKTTRSSLATLNDGNDDRTTRFSISIFSNIDERVKLNNWIKNEKEIAVKGLSLPYEIEGNYMFNSFYDNIKNALIQRNSSKTSNYTSKNKSGSTNVLSGENDDLTNTLRKDMLKENLLDKAFDNELDKVLCDRSSNQSSDSDISLSKMNSIYMSEHTELKPHEISAIFIRFAKIGKAYSYFPSKKIGLECYRWRHKLTPFLRIAAWILPMIRVFERPLWTYYTDNWNDDSIFPRTLNSFIDYKTAAGFKCPITLFICVGLALEIFVSYGSISRIDKRSSERSLPRNVLFFSCLCQLILQIIVLSIANSGWLTLTESINVKFEKTILISSFGDIFFTFWFNSKSFSRLQLLKNVIPKLCILLLFLFLLICIFAILGPYIFHLSEQHSDDDYIQQAYFDTFSDSIWSIFVAITSSSYPNQIMPEYRQYREFFLYFFGFIFLGQFAMLNLILVVVLVEFNRASQKESDDYKAACNVLLANAFNSLDVSSKGYVDHVDIRMLIDEYYKYYRDLFFFRDNTPSQAKVDLFIKILDSDDNGKIVIGDFLLILDVLDVVLRTDIKETFVESWFPSLFYSNFFKSFSFYVKHKLYNFITDTIGVILILIRLSIEPTMYVETITTHLITRIIISVYAVDIIFKNLAYGFKNYFNSTRNQLDFVITVALGVTSSLDYVINNAGTTTNESVSKLDIAIRAILMCRLILYPRNLQYLFPSSGFYKMGRIIRRIGRKIYTLSVLFICIIFMFCSCGVFLFGGTMYTSPLGGDVYHAISITEYGKSNFYDLNFNDFPSALVTLLCCAHVSDFDVITDGFVASTSSKYTRFYFTFWYIIAVLLLINILKSFFLSEFLVISVIKKKSDDKNQDNIGNNRNETINSSNDSMTGLPIPTKSNNKSIRRSLSKNNLETVTRSVSITNLIVHGDVEKNEKGSSGIEQSRFTFVLDSKNFVKSMNKHYDSESDDDYTDDQFDNDLDYLEDNDSNYSNSHHSEDKIENFRITESSPNVIPISNPNPSSFPRQNSRNMNRNPNISRQNTFSRQASRTPFMIDTNRSYVASTEYVKDAYAAVIISERLAKIMSRKNYNDI